MDLRFRRLFLLRFSLVLWTFYLVYVTGFFAYALLRPNADLLSRRRLDLQQQIRQAGDLLQRGRDADLLESLRHSLRLGRLDYYVWKKAGRVNSEGKVPATARVPDGQVVEEGDLLLSRLEAQGSELEFGVDLGWRARLNLLMEHERLPWAKDIFLLALGLAVILFVSFRNFAKAASASALWRPERFRADPKVLRSGNQSSLRSETGLFGAAIFPATDKRSLETSYAQLSQILRRYGGEVLTLERGSFLFALPADSAAAFAAARDLSLAGAAVSVAAGTSEILRLADQRVPLGTVWETILAGLKSPAAFG
ncbi:MAG: hypothetical protein EOP11_08180, partial [Proteobacteria bacterium]